MEIDLELLRTFTITASARTFAEAAARRHLSVSAISQQVKLLEGRLGVALFERVGRRARLTDAGRALAGSVREELARIDDALAAAARAETGVRGRIAIGSPLGFGRIWLMPRLPALLAAHPELQVELDFAVPSRLERRLADGELDVCLLVRPPELPGVSAEPIARETFVCAGAPRYLGKQTPRTAAELRQHRWVVFDRDQPMQAPWWRANFGPREPLPERIACFVASLDLMVGLVEEGVGLAILPDYLVEPGRAAGRLVVLASARRVENTLFLAHRRAAPPSARLTAVLSALAAPAPSPGGAAPPAPGRRTARAR